MTKIKGLIFDFDGLILDTELPNMQSWQEVYRSYGFELPFEKYVLVVGTDESAFNPLTYLHDLSGNTIDLSYVSREHRGILNRKLTSAELMPGVIEYLSEAKEFGLSTAIASSSSDEWVHRHLDRLGVKQYFDFIITAGTSYPAKPDPSVYFESLKKIGALSTEIIAFEDSVNGVRAARAADIFCVAIPNSVTVNMDFFEANLQMPSLLTLDLNDLINLVESI